MGKTAILMSASPGGLGGLRGLVQVRSILSNIHVAFNPDRTLREPKQEASIEKLGRDLAELLVKLTGVPGKIGGGIP